MCIYVKKERKKEEKKRKRRRKKDLLNISRVYIYVHKYQKHEKINIYRASYIDGIQTDIIIFLVKK